MKPIEYGNVLIEGDPLTQKKKRFGSRAEAVYYVRASDVWQRHLKIKLLHHMSAARCAIPVL